MDSPIRVLHTEWSDGWGGQEIRIINEMLAVREQGVEVFLACRDHSVIKQKAKENNINVFSLPFRGNTDLKTLFLLRQIIKKHRIDIVNTHSGKDTWVGGLAAKMADAKFIRTRHLSNRIRSSRFNFINELADYIVTTGESVRGDMIRYNRIRPEKIQSIPTGIDADVFDPAKFDRDKCRRRFSMQDDEIVIGIVAVLRRFKRHDLFIDSAKRLIEEYPDKKIRFVIAGNGPRRTVIYKHIERLGLQKRVNLLGHVDAVPELLSAIGIFALTSDSMEGVPQSVMQALMMKKAVVATNVGSTMDLLKNNNFLIVDSSVEDIKNGLSSLIRDSNKRAKLSFGARTFVVDSFSKRNMTSNIMHIYGQLVKPIFS